MKPEISRRGAVCIQVIMLFNYTRDFHIVDFRQYFELYRVGWSGAYCWYSSTRPKSCPTGALKTRWWLQESWVIIYGLFRAYLKVCDFAGADTACKFTQMGFTRIWRYGNHRGGKK